MTIDRSVQIWFVGRTTTIRDLQRGYGGELPVLAPDKYRRCGFLVIGFRFHIALADLFSRARQNNTDNRYLEHVRNDTRCER